MAPPKPDPEIVPLKDPLGEWQKPADEEFPSSRDLSIFGLENRIESLEIQQKALLKKLSVCLAVLSDELRFFEVGRQYGTWETYGELSLRMARLQGTINLIKDSMALIEFKDQRKRR